METMQNNTPQPQIQNQEIPPNPIQQEIPPQPQTKKSNTLIFALVGAIGLILVGLGGYYLSVKDLKDVSSDSSQSAISQKTELKNKKIIGVGPRFEKRIFSSYDLNSKETSEFLKLTDKESLEEAQVSPDGKKMYHITSNHNSLLDRYPKSISLVDFQGQKRKVDLARGNSWSIAGDGESFCFWSSDSTKLACQLIERDGLVGGAGTGLVKIAIYDYASEEVYDVFTSDRIAPPQGSRLLTSLIGWLGDEDLLIIQKVGVKEMLSGKPDEFYSVNIKVKSHNQVLPYRYGNGLTAVLFDSTEFFFKYSKLAATVEVLPIKSQENIRENIPVGVAGNYPILSENGLTLAYNSFSFGESLKAGYPPKGKGKSIIHFWELDTNQETIVEIDPIESIREFFLNGEKLVVEKQDASFLMDINTLEMEETGGEFIGSGYF